FGASSQQACLQTGIFYLKNGQFTSFCTISDNPHHGPAAIWAHLEPVICSIRSNYPDVNTVHFYSDGPCGKYRQKANFFLFATRIFEAGFTSGTWNLFESGHGRGV